MAGTAPLETLLGDWEEARRNSLEFIRSLGDEGLAMSLPRPGLDTFCKHFQEMIEVEEVYVNGIKQGSMNFDAMHENDGFPGKESAESLISRMEKVDAELRKAVLAAPENASVLWSEDESTSVGSMLVNLVSHEIFHIGQLVAFCYTTGVKLPENIVASWSLSSQNTN